MVGRAYMRHRADGTEETAAALRAAQDAALLGVRARWVGRPLTIRAARRVLRRAVTIFLRHLADHLP